MTIEQIEKAHEQFFETIAQHKVMMIVQLNDGTLKISSRGFTTIEFGGLGLQLQELSRTYQHQNPPKIAATKTPSTKKRRSKR